MQDDYENFVHFASHNENFECSECAHISLVGEMALTLLASLFGWKFCHAPPSYVGYYNGWIYYVMLCIDFNISMSLSSTISFPLGFMVDHLSNK